MRLPCLHLSAGHNRRAHNDPCSWDRLGWRLPTREPCRTYKARRRPAGSLRRAWNPAWPSYSDRDPSPGRSRRSWSPRAVNGISRVQRACESRQGGSEFPCPSGIGRGLSARGTRWQRKYRNFFALRRHSFFVPPLRAPAQPRPPTRYYSREHSDFPENFAVCPCDATPPKKPKRDSGSGCHFVTRNTALLCSVLPGVLTVTKPVVAPWGIVAFR